MREEDTSPVDLRTVFRLQEGFMEMLRQHDRLPEWPLDLTTKPGQRLIKEMAFNTVGELLEATALLKNKVHRLTDDRTLDRAAYVEEIGDAFAFLVEICLLSDIGARELHDEYVRKNAVVRERLQKGY